MQNGVSTEMYQKLEEKAKGLSCHQELKYRFWERKIDKMNLEQAQYFMKYHMVISILSQ